MRYIVGIDLGTTNSCVAYIDTQDIKLNVKSFKIPQLVALGSVEALTTLPSFCYIPSENEFPNKSLSLPWKNSFSLQFNFFVGSFAKKQGVKTPTRLIQSAKSWLCHSAAYRQEKILPVEASDESLRISPVEATTRYLAHIRDAWNEEFAKNDSDAEFDNQEIIVTVPASFDEVARNLTVQAAKKAGFLQITLLEEPQAAFYSWIAQHESTWDNKLKSGSQILVCDIGGGTTDFSLIEVIETESKLAFRRMAVGDHLLLGGDNMDSALAHYIETKFSEKGQVLTSIQQQQLFHEARAAKEKLLSKENDSPVRILIYGEGSQIVKGTISTEINCQEVQDLLLKGFFGHYAWEEALKLNQTSGLRSIGLPFENEPSIIKHLANFLMKNGSVSNGPIKPDFILFNGGALNPLIFQEAMIENLRNWFPNNQLNLLPSFHLDLAVSRGAAYFGKTRRGFGVKIGGGLARGYYLVLTTKNQAGETDKKALTLMPRASEEESFFEPSMIFMLTPNTPVSFQLASSHVRLNDQMGDLIPINPEEIHFLPPIQTVLRFGKQGISETRQEKIPVHLQIKLTPIGTLEIGLKSVKTSHHWDLEFQLRNVSGQDNHPTVLSIAKTEQTFDSSYLDDARQMINGIFSEKKAAIKLTQLTEKLEELLGLPKREWPLSVMRGLADTLLKVSSFRKLSEEHMKRWWNLIGFLLRPGFGYPLDDFKIKDLWKLILNDSKTSQIQELQIQFWICYRRIAGGLNKGQQIQLANELMISLFNKRSGKIENMNKSEMYSYSEKIRALAALELIDSSTKIRLGNALVVRLQSEQASSVDYWALGRIGARHLFYGSLANVVSRSICEEWIDKILTIDSADHGNLISLVEQLARKTEQRELNIALNVREKILKKFENSKHFHQLENVLLKECPLTQKEQDFLFGEHLPSGLLLET